MVPVLTLQSRCVTMRSINNNRNNNNWRQTLSVKLKGKGTEGLKNVQI